MHKITIIPVLLYGASPVETQNLASPKQRTHPPSAHYGYPSLYLPPRETQNFASLQGYATIIPSRFPLYNIAVHQSRDAKSCVSRATNTPVVSTLSLSLFALTSLVRRKILGLYKAVAIEGMVWGTALREPFVNLASCFRYSYLTY